MNENITFNNILGELIGTVTKIKAADKTNSPEATHFLTIWQPQEAHFERVKGYNDNSIKRHLPSLRGWKRRADAILDKLTVQTESKAITKGEETTKSSEPTALSIKFNKELTNLQATIAKVRAADTPEAKSFLKKTLESMERLEGSKNYKDSDLTPSLFKIMSNYQKTADAILANLSASEQPLTSAQFKKEFAHFKATVKKINKADTDYAPELRSFQNVINFLERVKDYNDTDIQGYFPGLRAVQKQADATLVMIAKTRAEIKATIASEKVALKAAITDAESIMAEVEKHKESPHYDAATIKSFKTKLAVYKEYASSYAPKHYNKAGADEIRNIRLNQMSAMRESLLAMATSIDEATLKTQFYKDLAHFKATVRGIDEADTTNAYEAEVKSYEAWIEGLDATTTSEAYQAEIKIMQRQADAILYNLALNEKIAQVSASLNALKSQILKLEKSYQQNADAFTLATGEKLYDAKKISDISESIIVYSLAREHDPEYFLNTSATDIASNLAYVTSVLNQVAKNKVAIAKKAELEKTESTKSATSEQGLISAQFKKELLHLKTTVNKLEEADKTNSPEATHFLTILPREIDHLDKIKNYNDNDIKIYLPGLSKLQKRADTILAELTGQTESKAITKSEEPTIESVEPTVRNSRFNEEFAHLEASVDKIKAADTTNVPGAKHFSLRIPGAMKWLAPAKTYKDKDIVDDYFTVLSHYQRLANDILAKITTSEQATGPSAEFKAKLAEFKATVAKIKAADTTSIAEAPSFLAGAPRKIERLERVKDYNDTDIKMYLTKLNEWQSQADAILVQTLGASAQFKQKLVHFKTTAAKLKEANTTNSPEASHFIGSLSGKIERLERVKDYNDTDIKMYLTKLNEWQSQADAILDKLAVQETQVSGNELKTAIAVRPNPTTNHQKIATGLGLTLAPLAIIIVAIGTRLLTKLKRNKNQAGSRK